MLLLVYPDAIRAKYLIYEPHKMKRVIHILLNMSLDFQIKVLLILSLLHTDEYLINSLLQFPNTISFASMRFFMTISFSYLFTGLSESRSFRMDLPSISDGISNPAISRIVGARSMFNTM